MTFYHQCEKLCDTFIYLNKYVGHVILSMEKIFKTNAFVWWFKILLQYDANIDFFLGFGMAMHYPSKFEKICYGAQCWDT
jgi:hypothetical protein